MGSHTLPFAMLPGKVGAVTPSSYPRLIFAMILAMALFSEVPDSTTWFGAALVVGSGIFALTRRA